MKVFKSVELFELRGNSTKYDKKSVSGSGIVIFTEFNIVNSYGKITLDNSPGLITINSDIVGKPLPFYNSLNLMINVAVTDNYCRGIIIKL